MYMLMLLTISYRVHTLVAVSSINYGAPADNFQLPPRSLSDWILHHG